MCVFNVFQPIHNDAIDMYSEVSTKSETAAH